MKKKLIISNRECGFGDNLLNAANLWLYAKKTNCALSICWYRSIYLDAKRFENAFYHFFDFPDSLEGVPIIRTNSVFFYYQKRIVRLLHQIAVKIGIEKKEISNQRDILTGKIVNARKCLIINECLDPNFFNVKELYPFFDALSLRTDLYQKLNKFAEKHFQHKKVIGIHIRYYSVDLVHSHHTKYWLDEAGEIKKIEENIEKEIKGLQEEYVLFLCTDSYDIQQHFLKKGYKNLIVLFKLKKMERHKGKELHSSSLSIQTTENSLLEMFLLAKCNTLIRNTNSWFNFYASIYVNQIINVHKSQN